MSDLWLSLIITIGGYVILGSAISYGVEYKLLKLGKGAAVAGFLAGLGTSMFVWIGAHAHAIAQGLEA